jgi:hypothetical protein
VEGSIITRGEGENILSLFMDVEMSRRRRFVRIDSRSGCVVETVQLTGTAHGPHMLHLGGSRCWSQVESNIQNYTTCLSATRRCRHQSLPMSSSVSPSKAYQDRLPPSPPKSPGSSLSRIVSHVAALHRGDPSARSALLKTFSILEPEYAQLVFHLEKAGLSDFYRNEVR